MIRATITLAFLLAATIPLSCSSNEERGGESGKADTEDATDYPLGRAQITFHNKEEGGVFGEAVRIELGFVTKDGRKMKETFEVEKGNGLRMLAVLLAAKLEFHEIKHIYPDRGKAKNDVSLFVKEISKLTGKMLNECKDLRNKTAV